MIFLVTGTFCLLTADLHYSGRPCFFLGGHLSADEDVVDLLDYVTCCLSEAGRGLDTRARNLQFLGPSRIP